MLVHHTRIRVIDFRRIIKQLLRFLIPSREVAIFEQFTLFLKTLLSLLFLLWMQVLFWVGGYFIFEIFVSVIYVAIVLAFYTFVLFIYLAQSLLHSPTIDRTQWKVWKLQRLFYMDLPSSRQILFLFPVKLYLLMFATRELLCLGISHLLSRMMNNIPVENL